MDKLNVKRSNCKASIVTIHQYAETHPVGTVGCEPQHHKAHLEELVDSFTDFKQLNYQIVDLLENADQSRNEEYATAVRKSFYGAKTLLQQCIDELEAQLHPRLTIGTPLASASSTRCDVQLPRMSLPTFSGDYTEWMSFSDIFRSAVDANVSLTNAQKFQYLKGSLRGDGLQVIMHFTVTNENYVEAWTKLSSRYDKKKKIVQAHIERFMVQPPVSQNSVTQLRQLTNTSDQVIRALKALTCESRDQWLIYILLSKLDNESVTLWSQETVSTDMPKLEKFLEFLELRCYALETVQTTPATKPQSSSSKNSAIIRVNHISHNNTVHKSRSQNGTECIACSQMHPLYQCQIFKGWDVPSRQEFIKNNQLCFNCLSPAHRAVNCGSTRNCGFCSGRHHSLLHPAPCSNDISSPQQSESNEPNATTDTSSQSISSHVVSSCISQCSSDDNFICGILPTAVLLVKNSSGQLLPVRMLFDQGSSACMISEKCVKLLGLSRRVGNLTVKGVAAACGGSTRGVTSLTLMSRVDKTLSLDITAYILDVLTERIPPNTVKFKDLSLLQNLELADPGFDTPNNIDIIVGSNKYLSTLKNELFYNNQGKPIAFNTLFGWVITCEIDQEEVYFSKLDFVIFERCVLNSTYNKQIIFKNIFY